MNKKTFSLSVIIPNYNKEVFISRCLESILKQTLMPKEIIVVDDCSTDGSIRIIKKWIEKNPVIKLIALDVNRGVSNARNTGAAVASSEFITFIDSDDFYFDCNKLKNEMAIIKNSINQKFGCIAYSKVVRVDIDDKIVKMPPSHKKWYLKGNIFNSLLAKRKFQTIPRDYCLSKESFVNCGGYSYPYNFYEDLDLLIRLSKGNEFYCTYEIGTAYRITPNGLSRKTKKEHAIAINKIVKNYKNKLSIFRNIQIFLLNLEWKFLYRLMILFKIL